MLLSNGNICYLSNPGKTTMSLCNFLNLLMIFFFNVNVVIGTDKSDSKLLLILMDGVRWDYLDLEGLDLPGFSRITSEGVKAEYLIPDFPTISYPNHYSIMTGLHSEEHGIVGNLMYDVRHKEEFLIGTNTEQYIKPYWWDDGEPLWVTAEKQNKRVYMYFWPGCDVTIRGVKPTFCVPYRGLTPMKKEMKSAITQGLEVLRNDSADIVGVYIELPDYYGHRYGPAAPEVKQAMQDIDSEMVKVLNEIEKMDIKVNMMIFSDHGMTSVSESRIVNITSAIDMDDILKTEDGGANVFIWPKEGKLEKVYSDLKGANLDHMSIYKKEEIPDRWFYKKHYRVSPILLVADIGWYIVYPNNHYHQYPTGPIKGTHGYDNLEEDMRAMFLARGPDININRTLKAFANIHLYQVMCHLTGITPSTNDGDWTAVSGLLRQEPISTSSTIHSFYSSVFIVAFAFLISCHM